MMTYRKFKIKFIFILFCFTQISHIQAQDKKLIKANEAYSRFAFIEAAKLYTDQLRKGNKSIEVYTKLGDCYYYNGNYSEAIKNYSKIIDSSGGIEPEYYFRYAQALNNNQNYKESERIMKMYYSKSEGKDLSADWNEKKLMEKVNKQSNRYTIKPLEINSPASDFGTAFNGKDKIIYASAKDTGVVINRKHCWNEKAFLKLYSADITFDDGLQNTQLLKGDVNTKYHQSTPAITKDGKTMYFTRDNYIDGKLGSDKQGITYLKIYVAQNVDGEWKNIKELGYPINSDGFSSGHPALSADESELYFVSDRNNKFGNSDLYVVGLKKNNFVGKDVKRLGSEINTLGKESFPFVDSEGVLYFSSDGHPGLGGLDVFAAIKDKKGLYHVENVGDGVNTASDDFSYVINNETKKGYFSSNRNGNDDIFSFEENRKINFDLSTNPIVEGILKYRNGGPIEGIAVEIYDINNNLIKTVYTNKEGRYISDLLPYKAYRLIYKKTDLEEKVQATPQFKPFEKRDYSFDFIKELEVVVGDKVVKLNENDDLTKKLQIDPIYYDYNGYKIRKSSKSQLNKIVEILKSRPSISIKVNSYTDSRGNDDFNMKLSKNRANTTVEYFVAHGINKERVTGEGFGENFLINNCSNGEECSEAEHQVNRRSEFIVHLK